MLHLFIYYKYSNLKTFTVNQSIVFRVSLCKHNGELQVHQCTTNHTSSFSFFQFFIPKILKNQHKATLFFIVDLKRYFPINNLRHDNENKLSLSADRVRR